MVKTDAMRLGMGMIIIYICLVITVEGALLGMNADEGLMNDLLDETITVGTGNSQVETSTNIDGYGVCIGDENQGECESRGCQYDSSRPENQRCVMTLQKTEKQDFSLFDFFSSILNFGQWVGKAVKLIGGLAFYPIYLTYIINNTVSNVFAQWIASLILFVYQFMIIYYIYGFITNWRGIKQQ